MKTLKGKKYLSSYKARLGPATFIVGFGIIGFVIWAVTGGDGRDFVSDVRSLSIVVGGTIGCLLFQFEFETVLRTLGYLLRSFIGSPEKTLLPYLKELDDCIVNNESFNDLRSGDDLTGKLLDDVVYMFKKGLVFEEIEDFISNRISTEYLHRKLSVSLLERGAKIAPALGLLGTVVGLIEVLKNLDDPTNIGPAMSLALMTTAFGALLGSLVFTPLAGRLANHNIIYLETHKLFMNRVGILMKRDERYLDVTKMNRKIGGDD